MNATRAIRLGLCSASLMTLGLFSSLGCQSGERSTASTSQSASSDGGSGRDQQADHMANDDTSRAEKILDDQKDESRRGAKPAVGHQREGTHVVDQPRVGRP